MRLSTLETLAGQSGVRGVAVVDHAGRTIARAGTFSPLLQAHLARVWGAVESDDSKNTPLPQMAELHGKNGLILAVRADSLLVLVHADPSINLGMLRLVAKPLREELVKALRNLLPGSRGAA